MRKRKKYVSFVVVVVVQLLSHILLFATPWTAAWQPSLSLTISQSLPKFMSMESVMLSNHLILCHRFSSCLQSFPASESFSSESAFCIRWPQYWSFSCSITTSNGSTGLISYRIDWFELLSVQATLKRLLQHHNSKASVLQHSAFFMVQLSHAYMATWKIIDLTRRNFVSKVMS